MLGLPFSNFGTGRFSKSGSSYTGPLDLVPGAAVAFSPARALSAAWIGQNVIKLRRDSDNATLDFVAGTDGNIDVAAVTAWLAGANAFVNTLYDQSGNGNNAVQATTTRQPAWIASTANSRPGLRYAAGGTGKRLVCGSAITFTGCNISAIAAAKATASDEAAIFGANAGSGENWIDFEQRSSGQFRFLINDATFAETRVVCPTDNSAIFATYFVIDGRLTSAAQDLVLNGVNQTLNITSADATGVNTAAVVVGNDDATGSSLWVGDILDEIIYATSKTAAVRAPARADIATYYGITI